MGMHYETGKGAVQSMENLHIMYDMATIIPAVLFGIMAIVLLVWYPLSHKKVAELQVLKEQRLKEAYESNAINLTNDTVSAETIEAPAEEEALETETAETEESSDDGIDGEVE